MQTACKNCIFAVYEGNTQIGCEFDRIKIFKDKGKVIPSYDEEKEFFVIDTVCNTARTINWPHKDEENRLDIVKKEIEITYDAIISTEEMPETVIDDLNEQTILPQNVFILVDNDDNKTKNILKLLRSKDLKINWRVINCFSGLKSEIGHLLQKSKSSHTLLIKHRFHGTNVIEWFNKALNEDLDCFVLITGDNFDFIDNLTYRTIGGINAIKKLAKDTDQGNLVWKYQS